ncbi:prepilin-type N-terminal cleavage/methylation domain-containing protein [bacterium]|nr:prepilin-type N-terminal cleavage/methylation domain-containing protein [bacterium]
MRRRKGFTIVEIMMVLLILSVISLMAIQNLHRGGNKAGAEGLALVISEEMKRVRQEAIARRRPTAFVLPTNTGTSPVTRSFYVMDGEFKPRITRTRNFKSEYSGAEIFVGTWNLSSGSWDSTDLKVAGSKWGDFEVSNWLPAGSSALNDNCFVFLPDGTVRTNGIKSTDKAYHILVSAGVVSSGNRTSATLTGAGESYTINVSPVGGITTSAGIYNESGGVTAVRGKYSTSIGFSAPSPVTVPAATPDRLGSNPKIYPIPNLSSLPPDNRPDALINKDQYVTLQMEATSTSGDQLFCQWKVDGPSGKTGAFSMQSQSTGTGAGGRMEWDQSLNGGVGAWKALWQWRPPADALPSEIYNLTCEVQNIRSGGGTVQIVRKFQIKPPGKVLFESDRDGHPAIYTMDASGQRERRYLDNCKNPAATLDGLRIVYVKNSNPLQGTLWLHTPMDPSGDTCLNTTMTNVELPSISPRGNVVAFFLPNTVDATKRDLCVMKVGVNAVYQVVDTMIALPGNPSLPGDTQMDKVAWSTSGTTLYYGKGNVLYQASITTPGLGSPTVGAPAAVAGGTGTGNVSSVTATFDNGILFTDNYSPYDPWIKRTDTGSRQYLSVGYEDGAVERNPHGSNQIMITHSANSPTSRQLHIVDITSTTTATVGGALTSAGNNTHPVWTR